MRHLIEDKIGGLAVQFKELTVAEIRQVMRDAEVGRFDLVDAFLVEECSLPELRAMTDLEADTLDALTPAELRQAVAKAKEVNPDFFAMRARAFQSVRSAPAGI